MGETRNPLCKKVAIRHTHVHSRMRYAAFAGSARARLLAGTGLLFHNLQPHPSHCFLSCIASPPYADKDQRALAFVRWARKRESDIYNNTRGDTPCACPRLYYYTVLFFYFLYKFVSSPWRPRISRGAATPCAPAAAARFSSLARARVHVGVNSVFDFPGG